MPGINTNLRVSQETGRRRGGTVAAGPTDRVDRAAEPDASLANATKLSVAARTMALIPKDLLPMGEHEFSAPVMPRITSNATVQRDANSITVTAQADVPRLLRMTAGGLVKPMHLSITPDPKQAGTVNVQVDSHRYAATLDPQPDGGFIATTPGGAQTLQMSPAADGFVLTQHGFPEIPSFVPPLHYRPQD